MKRLKTLKPMQPASSTQLQKSQKTFAIVILLSVVAAVALLVALLSIKTIGPRGTITEPDRIATYDAEFADYIGSGHNVVEYHYVDSQISRQLSFGYGPLYDVAGYQVIIGKTGAVGVIAYGKSTWGKWNMYPSPDRDWSAAFILVFDGCVAPQEWWNRPVSASMLYGVPTTDGGYLPELMVWVPWPDWLDFDNPPTEAIIETQSWYWDGNQYVQTHFAEDRFPLFSDSQISTIAPARGLSLCLRKNICYNILYERKRNP